MKNILLSFLVLPVLYISLNLLLKHLSTVQQHHLQKLNLKKSDNHMTKIHVLIVQILIQFWEGVPLF